MIALGLNKVDPRRAKKPSSIQYGYRKWTTHERVFSKHFRLGTAGMIEDKETEEEDKQKRVKMETSIVGAE